MGRGSFEEGLRAAGTAAAHSSEPAVSVVIPHLNQPRLLGLCLDALARQSFDRARTEILVVDNGSRESPAAVVAAHPPARLVHEAEPGPGPARNRGVALSRAPIIAFTDADCIPAPDWLARIVSRFAAEPATGILGGEVRVFAADPDRPSPAEAFDLVYGFRQGRQIARQNFAATANLAVRREVFAAVGPFRGITVAEDMEWGQRAARAGHPTRHAPEVVVHHPARAAMVELCAQWNRHIDHHFAMRARSRAGRARWLLTAGALALSPLTEIPTIWRSDRLPTRRHRLLALAGLTRVRLYRARRMIAVLRARSEPGAGYFWNRS